MKTLRDSDEGFTLIEIMVVVAIIALLAVLALPNFIRAREVSNENRFINNLRIIGDAFDMYAADYGGYPPDGLPRSWNNLNGMRTYLSRVKWTEQTPIGGFWDWDNNQAFGPGGTRVTGITVHSPPVTSGSGRQTLLEIDRKFDDGDFATGKFIRRNNNTGFIYVLERH
ncbi:type II secretion system protein [Kamptonema cortianum]|uniref:Type II secretion system protein n=1 Tax=Geitlerinema calcuttense NRMC-F 0142 TaxID=2922238 RepID=A0ABT7LXW1_9CYAN|nr:MULTISPECIES: type II secretion system protein [Cyanophyceae]MDK3156669.1 type II secretion system protein [Kamptonema cortianum]MDL5050322.1 type II secretion system protein [Oscillatoria amoena NRMC-F 0135]MDL5053406.1 type II secretion system protein [Oscillatoria laete-virens NRMC-F 0139]MDL5056624.1 type II secretion system protein [Geitlerinema calcuttense NRMC-F 0142]